jgi:putative ABC transport system permease protein
VDVPDTDLWVMDRETQYFDEGKALTDSQLYRVRGVPGVRWAVPLYKGIGRALAPDTQALRYVGRERNLLSYVLVKADAPLTEVAARIQARTGLSATTTEGFSWQTIAFYLANTGIPVNFGITIALAFLVGAVVAGQTFYLFTLENLKHYGALKAIGVTDLRLIGMILLQALVVGSVGYALGMGIAAAFFEITLHHLPTRGIVLMWQAVLGTGITVLAIIALTSLLSLRRVLVLEPAVVFRG